MASEKTKSLLHKAKSLGFSDRQIAQLVGATEDEVRALRKKIGLVPSYRLVDTCAAEFEAFTPYYYSTYDTDDDEVRKTDTKKVMILGGGPNRIGQGIEFDYCCVHAAFAMKELGFESIMVNSNPETVSTDYDTSDKLFFEPLTLEDVLHIYEREGCWGAIAQFGGQTPLNLALGLQKNGVNIIGTTPQSIEIAEDRKLFAAMLDKLGIPQPPNGLATNEEEALAAAKKVGYPVLVRPSFVLGGRAMQIVYADEELRYYMRHAVEASPERPVLVDKFLEEAIEVDVDCIADIGIGGETIVIGGLMEDKKTDTVKSVPLFGDIPLLGWFFRRTTKETTKTELLIFLTPHVASQPELLKAMSADELGSVKVVPGAVEKGAFQEHLKGMQRGAAQQPPRPQ